MNNDFPLISIIITTKNEEKNIGNCLKSILRQSYPCDRIEIIVVDNNSTDRTKEIAKKYTNKVFDLKEEVDLNGIKNFRGAQLNFGVNKAKGEVIFFPDADMTFDKDLITDAVGKLNDFDALFIPEVICGKSFFGKVRNFERSFYNETCIDAVRIIKKDLFIKIGGFDEKNIAFGPDDWDFTKRVKKETNKIDITKNKIYHHEEWMTWKIYLKKKGKYVNTFDGYVKKWGRDDPDVKKQLGFYYRFFGVFVENGKWKKALFHFILIFSVLSLKISVGFVYLISKNYERSK